MTSEYPSQSRLRNQGLRRGKSWSKLPRRRVHLNKAHLKATRRDLPLLKTMHRSVARQQLLCHLGIHHHRRRFNSRVLFKQ